MARSEQMSALNTSAAPITMKEAVAFTKAVNNTTFVSFTAVQTASTGFGFNFLNCFVNVLAIVSGQLC